MSAWGTAQLPDPVELEATCRSPAFQAIARYCAGRGGHAMPVRDPDNKQPCRECQGCPSCGGTMYEHPRGIQCGDCGILFRPVTPEAASERIRIAEDPDLRPYSWELDRCP